MADINAEVSLFEECPECEEDCLIHVEYDWGYAEWCLYCAYEHYLKNTKKLSLKRAFELTEEKLKMIIEAGGYNQAHSDIKEHEVLGDLRGFCPFCERAGDECLECEVHGICYSSYQEGDMKGALSELRTLKKKMLDEQEES